MCLVFYLEYFIENCCNLISSSGNDGWRRGMHKWNRTNQTKQRNFQIKCEGIRRKVWNRIDVRDFIVLHVHHTTLDSAPSSQFHYFFTRFFYIILVLFSICASRWSGVHFVDNGEIAYMLKYAWCVRVCVCVRTCITTPLHRLKMWICEGKNLI